MFTDGLCESSLMYMQYTLYALFPSANPTDYHLDSFSSSAIFVVGVVADYGLCSVVDGLTIDSVNG